MNIIDAIKSGKPFRRPGYAWTGPLDQATHQWLSLPKDNLIADDWEIKSEPREFWVVLYESGELYAIRETRNSADHCVRALFQTSGWKIIHVREVLND